MARQKYPSLVRAEGWAIALLVAHLMLGVLYSVAVPAWEAHDEWAHYKFAEYVARHKALPPPNARLTHEYEYDEASQPPLYYVLAALPIMLVDTNDGVKPDVNPYFGNPTGVGGINAAVHRSEQERFPWRGTILALHLARWVSLVISLAGLVAVYRLGRLLAPARWPAAFIALTVAALSPQYLFISSVVTNDVLIAALGCLVAWQGVQVGLKGLRLVPACGLALALGLALLSKLSALALLPFTALALGLGVTRSLRQGERRLRLGLTLLASLGCGLAIGGLWLVRNVRLTGVPWPRDPWLLFRFTDRWFNRTGAAQPINLDALPAALVYAFRTFWASFGWGNLEAYRWLYWFFAGLCLIGLLGLAWWLADSRGASDQRLAAWLLILLAVSVLAMAAYRDFDHGGTLIRGRYLLPALGAVAWLLALGLDAFLRHLPRVWQHGVPLALAGLLGITNLTLPLVVIGPAYAPPPNLARQASGPVELRPGEQPLGARFGQAAELVAYELWPTRVREGEALGVTLLWHTLRPLDQNYTLAVHLLDGHQQKVGEINTYPGRGNYATSLWQPGYVFRETYWIPVSAALAQPMLGQVKVAFFRAEGGQVGMHLPVTDVRGTPLGDAVIFGRFKLAPSAKLAAQEAEGPGLGTLSEANNAEEPLLRLSRATWEPATPHVVAGSAFTVTLTWEVLGQPMADYRVFVHLVGADGPVAFGDGPPQGGAYPTGLWEPGERVVDTHLVVLPSEMPAGQYPLVVGMYSEAAGRLLAYGPDRERLPADQIVLGRVTVARLDYRSYVPLLPAQP